MRFSCISPILMGGCLPVWIIASTIQTSTTGQTVSWKSPSSAPKLFTTPASHDNFPRSLSGAQGQVWRDYDLRSYTHQVAPSAKPEQAVVDWILRETGTEAWFSEPLGLLSASRDRLRVYHTPARQAVVKDIVERLCRTGKESHVFGVRLITLTNLDWRAKAFTKLCSVSVQTPGVEAWLMAKEDSAVLVGDLRKRMDFREHNSPNLMIYNGQSHDLERISPVAYIRSRSRSQANQLPAQPEMDTVEEGFRLRLSPLLSLDGHTVDAVVTFETTQVEQMIPLWVNIPSVSNPHEKARIQVPQTSNWKLHERFRWPANQVLLISCGMVATPRPERRGMLANPTFTKPATRAEALLVIDAKGRTNSTLAKSEAVTRTGGLNYRGRY